MVHVRAALGDPPIGIVFQQLDIELVEAARGANVERTFAHLLDGADPGKWQEETEMIRELGEGAGDGFAACQILRLGRLAVRRQNELGLGPRGGGAVTQRGELGGHCAGIGDGDVDIAGLKNAAHIGFVRRARAQPLEGRSLVAESLKEGERELLRVKGTFRSEEHTSELQSLMRLSYAVYC